MVFIAVALLVALSVFHWLRSVPSVFPLDPFPLLRLVRLYVRPCTGLQRPPCFVFVSVLVVRIKKRYIVWRAQPATRILCPPEWGDMAATRRTFTSNHDMGKARITNGDLVDMLILDLFEKRSIAIVKPLRVTTMKEMKTSPSKRACDAISPGGAEAGPSSPAPKKHLGVAVPPPPEGWGGAF